MLPNHFREQIPRVKQMTVQHETRPNWTSGNGCFRLRFSFGYCVLPTPLPTTRWVRRTTTSTIILMRNLGLNRHYPGIVWSRKSSIPKDSTRRPVCGQFGENVQTTRCSNYVRPANILGLHSPKLLSKFGP